MKFQSLFFIAALAFSGTLFSCKKESEQATPLTGNGSIALHFDNVFGDIQMSLDSTGQTFTNAAGEKLSVTQFNYYVSNISLQKEDGSVFTIPQDSSYFLIQENEPETQELMLRNVPVGDYVKVNFTVGVDSLRSTMDLSKRTGVLAPDYLSGHGMYWSWNSGYIFLKIEGFSPASPDSLGNTYYYHIGGFGGYSSPTPNNIRKVSLNFPDKATVRTNITPEAHMLVDAKKIWEGMKTIKISDQPANMWGLSSLDISANYKEMFMVHHVHND
jgi:hypothetical protein